MANIRAYKLAEELGIDRVEFVEKAAAIGVDLKSAMAAIDDAVAQELRQRLGSAKKDKGAVTESRVQRGKGGAAVIRRRKKEPEPEAPEPVAPAGEPLVADAVAEPESIPEEAVPEPEPAPGPDIPSAPPQQPQQQPAFAKQQPQAPAPERPAGPDKSGKQRKLVREVVNLREQERLARQATGRAATRRHVTIDPRTAVSPRRKRRDALAKPVVAKPAADAK